MSQLLSEIRNVHIRATPINYTGSSESADSLDKCAGLQNLITYVKQNPGAGLCTLLAEEQK